MQQCLKPAAGAARTWIVAAQLLDEDLAAADDTQTALDARFGVSAAPALGGALQLRFSLES
jgi:hypothetical protein